MNAARQGIFTPRTSIARLTANPDPTMSSVCTKIPYLGFEVSISMDSSCGAGDLRRSDIRVYNAADRDVTDRVFPNQEGHDVQATAEALMTAFRFIETHVRNQ